MDSHGTNGNGAKVDALHCDSLHCDALIVGGGPAGLAAGIALRQKGLDVIVADALYPPIDKACGEGLMPDSRADLAALGILLDERDGAPFSGIAFLSRQVQAAAPFRHGMGIGVRRLHLHSVLAERCRQLGVRLAWGSRMSLETKQTVKLNGKHCVYRYLIGADGQASQVRQWSGLCAASTSSKRFGIRRHYRAEPWSRMVEVHWGDLGQAYVTPVAADEVCVATIARDAGTGMDAVLDGLPALRQHLQQAPEVGRARGGVSTTRKLRHVSRGNVALVGDASGSADAVTGEGIALSFRQARLLAEAVEQDNLALYDAGHAAILRLPQRMAKIMLSMDRWPWLRDRILNALAADPQLFGNMLAVHLGEQSIANFVMCNGAQFGRQLLAPSGS